MAIEISKSGVIKVPRGYAKAREMILNGSPIEQVAEVTGKDIEVLREIAALKDQVPQKAPKEEAGAEVPEQEEDIDDLIDSI